MHIHACCKHVVFIVIIVITLWMSIYVLYIEYPKINTSFRSVNQLWHSFNRQNSVNVSQSQLFALLSHLRNKDPLIEDEREIYNPKQRNKYIKPNKILIANEKLEPNSKDEIFLPSQYTLNDIDESDIGHEHEATIVLAMILDETADDENQPVMHQREAREEKYFQTLTLPCPMVIFLSENNNDHVINETIRIRNQFSISNPTLIVTILQSDLIVHSKIYDMQHEFNVTDTKQNTGIAGLMWASKIHLVTRVALKNPFYSKYFVWMDSGFFRDNDKVKWLQHTIDIYNQSNETVKWPSHERLQLLDDDKVHFIDLSSDGLRQSGWCDAYFNKHKGTIWSLKGLHIAGGGFAASRDAIIKFDGAYSQVYHDAWYHWKTSKPGYEQFIFTHMACRYPDLVTLVREIRSDNRKSAMNYRSIVKYLEQNSTAKSHFVLARRVLA